MAIMVQLDRSRFRVTVTLTQPVALCWGGTSTSPHGRPVKTHAHDRGVPIVWEERPDSDTALSSQLWQ